MKTVSLLQKFAVGVFLACSFGSPQAAVLFTSTGISTLTESVVGLEFNTHFFTATSASDVGMYELKLIDLDLLDNLNFLSPATTLSAVTSTVPTSTFYGTADARPGTGTDTFLFPIFAPGSFAAYVKAVIGGTGYGAYELQLTKVGPIPEPGIWLLMIGGLGLIGWMRIRKSQELS